VNGIAAKIAQEIGVLFKDQNFDTGTRKQIAQHHCRLGRHPRYSSPRKFFQAPFFTLRGWSREGFSAAPSLSFAPRCILS